MRNVSVFVGERGPVTHHATTPGKPAYAPATTRKVPKYFAPMLTGEMLMMNPTQQKMSPARTNGYRFLMRSDQTAKMTRRMAG